MDGGSARTAVTVYRDVGWQHAAAGSTSSRPFCADANTASLPMRLQPQNERYQLIKAHVIRGDHW